MDLKSKALVVIEYISLHIATPEAADIYMAAHVANGHCPNPHESWLEWLNAFYDGLVASGNFNPESQLTKRAPDVCQRCGSKWTPWDEVLDPDLCAICGTRR
jgi:hypothetical protein